MDSSRPGAEILQAALNELVDRETKLMQFESDLVETRRLRRGVERLLGRETEKPRRSSSPTRTSLWRDQTLAALTAARGQGLGLTAPEINSAIGKPRDHTGVYWALRQLQDQGKATKSDNGAWVAT